MAEITHPVLTSARVRCSRCGYVFAPWFPKDVLCSDCIAAEIKIVLGDPPPEKERD